jgi:Acetyltransferases, including N-acetylases of ribosomal proteins
MDITQLSQKYQVRRLETEDIPELYALCKGNPLYFQHCPPAVTMDSLQEDMLALPKGKTLEDKYYLGFYQDDLLIAVIDLICRYPNVKTAFIGFFMMNKKAQGKGVGTAIVEEMFQYLRKIGFSFVRLGYVKGNHQSEAFWLKNHFEKTEVEIQAKNYVIVVMQRQLE